jgi:hypothetical protein
MDIEQWLYSLPLRWRAFFHRNQVDQEMKEELRGHLEQQIGENIAQGMPPEEARRSALRAMGGLTQIERRCRDARGGSLWEDFTQDFRFDIRQLLRNRGFSALVSASFWWWEQPYCSRVSKRFAAQAPASRPPGC